ncbi:MULTISPECIES: alpha-xylosidase [unclassified Enterococcus]|uniref:alpha-xylosidase n=1 Tax=unclassified Enterococcus TaxID=2608891 RepID=UPI001CE0955F|nr:MULTISPECIES: alpha-xylosidase [unclassified Enterococcus]MCA5013919.1 alpha-xylosidase [Enterococcus sp. S23]MCA5017307.1 alpha-xylosidase [Enterococcus sp. S22(2020)]
MKFTDGYWMTKEGFTIQSPKEVFSYQKNQDSVVLYAPYKKIERRGDTLNLGMSTITLSSPQTDMISVKIVHHDKNDLGPNFELTKTEVQPIIEETAEQLSFTSGNLKATVALEDKFRLRFFGDEQLLTESKFGAQGEIIHTSGKHFMREQLSLGIDEQLYGLGERFTPFIKNGQTVDIWNEDGGTGSEQAYKNIPFYLSSNGYGVFVNHPEKVSFEMASENVSRAQFSVEGEALEYIIIYGPTPKEILEKYTNLTGKPTLPPAWSFGLWLSTSFTTDYSEETVMTFIDGMLERDIPLEVFHFDCFWMKAFEWCNFKWDEDLFPDPKGMLQRIHDKGIKVCVWINPYIGQKSPLFEEGRKNGYFLKQGDGNVWQWDMWQAGQGIVDFTNPEAVKWYQGYLADLLDMGVDSFKTDFGERIPTDAVYFDGSDPNKAHNYYSYLYNEAVFSLLEEKRGKNEAVLFARSGTVGSQKFPVHWGGDNLSEYVSMTETLRGGLSFLLSGFGFWSHDIGGFEENASADIYKRWTQFGLLSTHSRYHGNIEYRVPWNYDEEAVAVTRKFTKLKVQLMPYLYQQAVYTATTGVPMMRPVFMEYPKDRNSYFVDKQYFLGDNLLVAPVFTETGEVSYYLPEGRWTQLLDHSFKAVDRNGQWQTEQHDYLSLPVWVKENTILVMAKNEHPSVVYDYNQELAIHCYQLSNGVHEQLIVNSSGNPLAKIIIEKDNEHVVIRTEGLVGENDVYIHENERVITDRLTETKQTIEISAN